MARYGYFVETWDVDEQKFTPQAGIPVGPYSFRGLFAVVRALRYWGYSAGYSSVNAQGDPFVSIWREKLTKRARLRHKVPNFP